MTGRLAKIIMCAALGLYAGLVAVDNVVDYDANYAFVQHVLSMDTTIPGSIERSRAITDPTLWRLAYGLIIAAEGATSVLFVCAAVALWRARRAAAGHFQQAKRWVHAAATMGFLVWFAGFEVIGGEYFAMWQSPHWNGQQAGFRFYMTLVAELVFVKESDPELPERAGP